MTPRATTSRFRAGALLLLVLAAWPFGPAARAQDRPLADLRAPYPHELRMDGFVLKTDQEVRIEAVGPAALRDHARLVNAWILDADTREVVWELDAEGERDRRGDLTEVTETRRLPAGAYEVYYASYPIFDRREVGWNDAYDWDDVTLTSLGTYIRDFFDGLFDNRSWNGHARSEWDDRYRDEAARFGVTVRGTRDGYNEKDRTRLAGAFLDGAFVSLTNLRDDQYVHQGFTLARPMDVEVYAIGELRRDEGFDYGWILNADTHDRVWEMRFDATKHGGGAEKNRVANEVLHLPAGRYAAFFVTDDSHSAEAWNEAPPYDPLIWGMALLPKDAAQRSHVTLFDYEDVRRADALVDLTRMRDDDHRSQGFTLKAPMDVRVVAVGEGSGGELYDYGWIVDAATRERVWEMKYHHTEHAGGGEKNRMADDVVSLKAGSYVAYFVTDDSHAYGDWNTGAPFDREAYGLAVYPTTPGARDRVLPYEESADPAIVAQLTGVRDDARRRQRFTLDRETPLRVYAVGEGTDGDMYDYGWIQNDRTGDVVWEMSYRMTRHAGGADKNRMVNTVVTLPAGEYTLYFETDDSHSFSDWNDAPPADAAGWGITLRRAGR